MPPDGSAESETDPLPGSLAWNRVLLWEILFNLSVLIMLFNCLG